MAHLANVCIAGVYAPCRGITETQLPHPPWTRWQTTFSNTFFFNENILIFIQVSLKFVPAGVIDITSAFVRLGAEYATSHYLMQWWPNLPTHICIYAALGVGVGDGDEFTYDTKSNRWGTWYDKYFETEHFTKVIRRNVYNRVLMSLYDKILSHSRRINVT